MKTEHELLKEICDLIWYEISLHFFWKKEMLNCHDVREIIFTQEFMDRLWFYLIGTMWMSLIEQQKKQSAIVFYCNNPVKYLATILNIKQD